MKGSLLWQFEASDLEKTAWECDAQSYSYSDCLASVEIRRTWIRAHGLRGIQAIHGFSPFETWLWTLAAWEEGLCAVPLSARITLSQYQMHLAQLPEHGLIHPKSRSAGAPGSFPSGEEQLLIFTSGSTGSPKAIGHTLRGLIRSAHVSNQFYCVEKGDRWLLSLDLSHIGGLQIALRSWLARGTCVYAGEPKDAGKSIHHHDIDFVSLVPTQLHRCLMDKDQTEALRACKAVLVGGAETSAELWEKARSLELPLSITYGCTEAASQIAAFPPGTFPGRPHCVGELLPHWSLNEAYGRLWLSGASLYTGYYQQGQWHPQHGFALPDQGYLDGRWLMIQGRFDQIFQVGAENLAPAEIIEPLKARGLIDDAVVLAKDDPDFGKLPLLVIRGPLSPPLPAIQSVFEETLIPVKRPREIWWHASDEVAKPSKSQYEEWVFGDKPSAFKLLWTYARQSETL